MLELSPRLKSVAELVRKGSVIADIGTDHAFLPAYLILNDYVERALACDLRKGPLCNAEKTAQIYHIRDKIELRLSDGLDAVLPDEAYDIVICGMGGTLIRDILQRAEWIKNRKYRLILQPQSHSEDLRLFLITNGFVIISETVCEDAGRSYNIICSEYSGEIKVYPEYYPYFGDLIYNKDPNAVKIVKKQLKYLKVRRESEYKFGDKIMGDHFDRVIKETERLTENIKCHLTDSL